MFSSWSMNQGVILIFFFGKCLFGMMEMSIVCDPLGAMVSSASSAYPFLSASRFLMEHHTLVVRTFQGAVGPGSLVGI